MTPFHKAPAVAAVALALSVAACGHNPMTASPTLTDRECLARAMYFESNRSSEDGMVAVGTVVMNRLDSGRYPGSVCGIVGQRNQFAPGVLSNAVGGRSWQLALAKADQVLAGERHRRVGTAMHFHTAGYTFPYRNMAYVVAAGGNVFYDKKTPGTFTPIHPNVLVAEAQRGRTRPSETIALASAEEVMPIRRPEPSRLADRDENDDRPATARPPYRAALTRHDPEPPRIREKTERIRLANLEDEAMPKALRQRSDVAPGFRLPASHAAIDKRTPQAGPAATKIAHASSAEATRVTAPRSTLASVPANLAPRRASDQNGSSAKQGHGPRFDPAKIAARIEAPTRPSAAADTRKATAAKPSADQPLPYRDAKTKTAPVDALAKTGWKRGPEPAAAKPVAEKAKTRG